MNIRQSGKLSGCLFYKKFNNRNTWILWKENIRNEEKIITAFYTSFLLVFIRYVGFFRASEKKIRETHGYFIINEKEAIFGLSEEELQKRIKNKIEFKALVIMYQNMEKLNMIPLLNKKFFTFILNS